MNIHGDAARGAARAGEYMAWSNMIQRCTNSNNPRYDEYGGRGIGVCEAWLEYKNFITDMGRNPGDLTLERIDNDKGYSPENCRWAASSDQRWNQRPRCDNQLGVRGVSFDKRRGKYYARHRGKFLGYFDTMEEAVEVKQCALR